MNEKEAIQGVLEQMKSADAKIFDSTWLLYVSSEYGDLDHQSDQYAHLFAAFMSGMANMVALMGSAIDNLSPADVTVLREKLGDETAENLVLIEQVKKKLSS